MIDIRARNFKNPSPAGMPVKRVRTVYTSIEGNPRMAKTRAAPKPKMGRPRKSADVIRVSQGVRINPDLLKQVNEIVSAGYLAGVTNFSEAVELALTRLVKFKPKKSAM